MTGNPPNGTSVRLNHLEELNLHRDAQCGRREKMILDTRSRLDRLEGRLWILWPILLLLMAIVANDYFRK